MLFSHKNKLQRKIASEDILENSWPFLLEYYRAVLKGNKDEVYVECVKDRERHNERIQKGSS
jgi:hypothetical protein